MCVWALLRPVAWAFLWATYKTKPKSNPPSPKNKNEEAINEKRHSLVWKPPCTCRRKSPSITTSIPYFLRSSAKHTKFQTFKVPIRKNKIQVGHWAQHISQTCSTEGKKDLHFSFFSSNFLSFYIYPCTFLWFRFVKFIFWQLGLLINILNQCFFCFNLCY